MLRESAYRQVLTTSTSTEYGDRLKLQEFEFY